MKHAPVQDSKREAPNAWGKQASLFFFLAMGLFCNGTFLWRSLSYGNWVAVGGIGLVTIVGLGLMHKANLVMTVWVKTRPTKASFAGNFWTLVDGAVLALSSLMVLFIPSLLSVAVGSLGQ